MKILVDMNLPPELCGALRAHGWEAVHWSTIGAPNAAVTAIMRYAVDNVFVVLSHDLDFSAILATTQADAPSVIQIRTQDVLSRQFQLLLISALQQFESVLEGGAIVVIDATRAKARVLPLTK